MKTENEMVCLCKKCGKQMRQRDGTPVSKESYGTLLRTCNSCLWGIDLEKIYEEIETEKAMYMCQPVETNIQFLVMGNNDFQVFLPVVLN